MKKYFYNQNGKSVGPFTKEQMLVFYSLNTISQETYIIEISGTEWVKYSDVFGDQKIFIESSIKPTFIDYVIVGLFPLYVIKFDRSRVCIGTMAVGTLIYLLFFISYVGSANGFFYSVLRFIGLLILTPVTPISILLAIFGWIRFYKINHPDEYQANKEAAWQTNKGLFAVLGVMISFVFAAILGGTGGIIALGTAYNLNNKNRR